MLYEEESGDIRFGLVGDALISRRLRPYREPRFLALRDILQAADVSIANSETLFHAYESSPISDSGPYGTYAACDPEVIDDLKWMGIKMVSTANNHVVDFGEEGVLINMRNLHVHNHEGGLHSMSRPNSPGRSPRRASTPAPTSCLDMGRTRSEVSRFIAANPFCTRSAISSCTTI